MRQADDRYRPPAPFPVSPNRALLRAILNFERDLITLLPAEAYRQLDMKLGYSRRGIYLLSSPAAVRDVMRDRVELFPKNDLMVGALSPLVGDGLFISGGAEWERQRRMIDPAFGHMRLSRAFGHMEGAVADYADRLDRAAVAGEVLSLEAEMSALTADIVFRTIFSRGLDGGIAARVFEAFARFQRAVANVELRRLLFSKAWAEIPQPPRARAAAAEIRGLIGTMLDERLARPAGEDDIAADIVAARDPLTGEGFTRDEMIDQLAVFFLAGHETTASVLSWTLFVLSQQPEAVARLRAEVREVTGGRPPGYGEVKRLVYTRNVFREALRLYPPVTFLARVPIADVEIGGLAVPRGAMLLISPWVIHRHEALWQAPDRFDPDRFSPEREGEIVPGAYLPFGLGPRVCVGTAFAMAESALILATLVPRFDVETLEPAAVRPVARLTTRPARDIRVRARRVPGRADEANGAVQAGERPAPPDAEMVAPPSTSRPAPPIVTG